MNTEAPTDKLSESTDNDLAADSIAKLAEQKARREKILVFSFQIGLFAVALVLWETLTRIPWFIENTIFDPFFISRPSHVAVYLFDWTLGSKTGYLWPHLISTLTATLLGLVIAVVSGFVVGLYLSQHRRVAEVFNPFIVGFNSLPRIAFVPLITMIFGLGLVSKIVTAWFIVFFLVFFNTFKGGRSVEQHLVDFCRTLGANERQLMWTIRIPTTLAWAFAALPNAVSFSLIGVVISEFVGSTTGMGYLLITSLATLNSAEMFAAITVLSVLGVVLVTLIRILERRVLHWAPEFRDEY